MFKLNQEKPNLDSIQDFLNKWKIDYLPSKQILYDYKPFCKNLLFEDEEIVLKTIDLLKKNIMCWADEKSIIYKNQVDYISKDVLRNKKFWYVDDIKDESRKMSTSGSTTGNSFTYLAWNPMFEFLELDNHYDMILDEFKFGKNLEVLCFFKNSVNVNDKFILTTKKIENFVHSHGLSRKTRIHYVNFGLYEEFKDKFFSYLFKYLSRNKIDVFFAAGPEINALCYYIRKFDYKGKVADLVSNSNEMLLQTDVDFLFDGNYVNNICDHMRCWDGGATFFTCKAGNYHLCDNLSWSEEIDGKLITTDYFSLPSPFVKYWNGDLCKIDNKYQRCECGRLYRDFEFLESRPFSLKGQSIEKYKEQIKNCGINTIKQVKCSVKHIEVVTTDYLSEEEKNTIKNILHKFDVEFSVEKEIESLDKIVIDTSIKYDYGYATAECVADESGNSYVWQITSECKNVSSGFEESCKPDFSINGSPCVFLGNKTEVECVSSSTAQKDVSTYLFDEKTHSKIVFSLAKCTGTCNYFCFENNTPIFQNSDCSSGCACVLDPIGTQCFAGSAISVVCQ